jgi:hypothetical protein
LRKNNVSSRSAIHWPSLAQFAFSAFVLLAALGLSAGLAISGGLGWARSPATADQSLTRLIGAAGAGLVGLLALPSVGLSLARLLGRSLPGWALRPFGSLPGPLSRRIPILIGLLAVWAAALAAGSWSAVQGGAGQLALVPLFLLVVALPVAIYLVIGAGGLSAGSLQRRWGIFVAALIGTSGVVLVVEILVFGLIAVGALVVLASHPDTLNLINRLAQRITNAQITPENLGRILRPYIQPWMIYLGVAIVAGLAPLIEEALKPLPLWLFARRGLTPAEGFVGGLLCGAGFALFESMGDLAAITGPDWAVSAAARGGTDLLHILNAGLMGWALALAWGEGRHLRLALTYLLVVGIHGLWNSISIAMAVLPLVAPAASPLLTGPWVTGIFVGGLIVLYVCLFFVLVRTNRRLAPVSPPPAPALLTAPDEPTGENPL